MGLELLDFFKSKVKKEYKIAFFTTFIITLLVHLYKFTNTLPNLDSIMNYYSNQNILASGRWALSLACGLSSYYDLPWVIAIFSCLFISLTVVVIIKLFKIDNPILITLIGALIGSSPATTETFFFQFTADGYMLSMLLAALAVYFSRIDENRNSYKFFSIMCICLSCGIYQAYVSFALILAVCYFIDILLNKEYSKQDCINWMIKQVIIYSVSLLLYYIIWKLSMKITGTSPNNYQGISSVGSLNFYLLYTGLKTSILNFIGYFVKGNIATVGITNYSLLNILFLIMMFSILLVSLKKSKLYLEKWKILLFSLSIISIIPFSSIWCFTSDGVQYRAMMLQSLVILYVFTAILYEKYAKINFKNAACIFFVIMVINNSLIANINYFYLNLCYENTYAESLEMVMRIHQLQDNQTFKNIAVFGERKDDMKFTLKDTGRGKYIESQKDFVYGREIYRSLIFSSETISNFIEVNYGFKLVPAKKSVINDISKSRELEKMKCWPAKDSMKVINNTLVIKFNDNYKK